MIEVVKNANTTANINKDAGGTKAVLRVDTIAKWLKKRNPAPEQWAKAQVCYIDKLFIYFTFLLIIL